SSNVSCGPTMKIRPGWGSHTITPPPSRSTRICSQFAGTSAPRVGGGQAVLRRGPPVLVGNPAPPSDCDGARRRVAELLDRVERLRQHGAAVPPLDRQVERVSERI